MPFKNYAQQEAMFAKGGKSAKAAHRFAHTYGTLDAQGNRYGPGGKKASLTGQTKKKVRHRPKRKVKHSRARSNSKGQLKAPLGYAQRRFQNLTKKARA